MKTKYIFISSLLLAAGIGFGSCDKKTERATETQDSTLQKGIVVPDTALYGSLGEGTGMSCVEIITKNGDTLTLNKINENTGEAGVLLGSTERYGDPLTITTDANRESIRTLVNLKTLTQSWQTSPDSISLKLDRDGKVSARWEGKTYNYWSMCNAHLLLGNKNKENWVTACDTFEIRELSRDSLILASHTDILKFYKK